MKKLTGFIVLLVCFVMLFATPVSAFTSYTTYSYTIDEWAVETPAAYVPERVVTSNDIGLHFLDDVPLEGPTDLFIDKDGYIYIADPRSNRVVILNPDYTHRATISQFVNSWGVPDGLDQARGVFANDNEIFVADTEKNRIVVFSKGKDGAHEFGEHLRIIEEPTSDIFNENHVYKPIAVAVDRAGRLYVVSSTTNQGIITMSPTGSFQGFIGASRAVVDPFTVFWRNFQTQEQRRQSIRAVSTEFNNIAIDDEGFVWVTTSSIEEFAQQRSIEDNDRNYSPIRRLNPQGTDVLRRSGKVGPGGELVVMGLGMSGGGGGGGRGSGLRGTSRIIGVAIGPEGTWSIIDEVRQRVYTYDEDGQVLFIFGDEGQYFGNIMSIQAVAYQGTKMLLLDRNTNSFTVYKRTEYGDVIISALENQRNRLFDKSVDDWREILKRNNNSDLAYIGIGKSMHRDGEYQEAMREFKFALDVESYSKSFKEYRKLWVENYVIVIPIVMFVVIFGVSMFLKNAKKVNARDTIRGDRKLRLSSHMLYGFYIIFRPFDGFWDMKKEKRGSVLAATIYLILACASYFYQGIGTSFLLNPGGFGSNFIMEAISIIVPVTLWVISNWCLTTLFDGEGSMKDIYMATCYALVPIAPFIFANTMLTHIITWEERTLLALMVQIMWIWVGALLFFGAMVVHDYSLGKNVLTVLGSVGGMMFIMFVAMLFSGLLMRMVTFVNSIYIEMSYRF